MNSGPSSKVAPVVSRFFRVHWLGFLLITGIQSIVAQSPLTPISRVKDVLSMPTERAKKGDQKVKLKGVVTDLSARGDECSIHDGEACISLALDNIQSTPAIGDLVEVEGEAFAEPFFEGTRTRIRAANLQIAGKGELPPAPPSNTKEVAEFQKLDQWVSVEGTVLQVRSSMSLFTIQLVAESAVCNVIVRDWPRDAIPRDWIGGKIRAIGVNRPYLAGSRFLSLISPTAAQVTVVKTGTIDPLDAPKTTASALVGSSSLNTSERVKLKGTLLAATTGNVYYVRGEEGGSFSFYMLHPIDEDKSGRFSTPIVIPTCVPGDKLEVVGVPGFSKPGLHLNFCVARVTGKDKEPSALSSDIATVNSGSHVHDLVELQGRVLSVDEVLVAPDRWRTTIKLGDGEHRIIAFLDGAARGTLGHIQLDHLLQLKGIVTGAPHFPEIRLWIRGPEDVKSLGVAPDEVKRRLWTVLGIALIIMAALVAWVWMLRRSRRLIDGVNASLERRVAERTAELAAAKDDLALALSKERELGELKTRFVSLVSHEFRTPLGIIMSAVEVLRHFGHKITPEKHTELYGDIHSATVQMSGLMEQVLVLGRVEANKLGWSPAPVNLPELCAKIVDEANSVSHGRCPLNLTSDGDFQNLKMDEALLRHIVGNLVSNAIKYSPEGSPVDVHVAHHGEEVVLSVRDRGIGIPVADQSNLFEAFHRGSNVGEIPGTGLGLLLVKHCVELHHGSIDLVSDTNVGTTFTVRLPTKPGTN